jgi:hypothetical protein
VVGYGPFSLCVIQKEGLCPSSGDINRMMMMIDIKVFKILHFIISSQIFLRDAYIFQKLLSYEEYCIVKGGKPIAV